MIKVLIVDDHALVRAGIKHMLDDVVGLKVVGEAETGEVAVKLAREVNPHVVLMDVQMPGIGGLEATRKLLRANPDLKILVLTVCTNDFFPSRLLQAGALGYITKGASMVEMVRAIRAIHAGQRYISPEIASQLALKHLTDAPDSPFDNLSTRELQVALMIVHGVKIPDIAKKMFISPKTVNSYRYRIFEKMHIDNDVQLTLIAMQHGLIEEVEKMTTAK